jgi:hypothetical protein
MRLLRDQPVAGPMLLAGAKDVASLSAVVKLIAVMYGRMNYALNCLNNTDDAEMAEVRGDTRGRHACTLTWHTGG